MFLISNEAIDKLDLLKNFSHPYYLIDDKGFIQWGNDKLWQLLGYSSSPDGSISMHPGLLEKYESEWKLFFNQLANYQSFCASVPILTLHGELLWLELDLQPFVLGEYSTEFLYIVSARDITEKKHLEDKLAREEYMLEKTGEMAGIGGWEYDLETEEILWTKEIYRMYNLSL